MVNRLYKLTAIIFLLFSGFSASARGGLYHYNHKNSKKVTVSSTVEHQNRETLEFILNNVSAPVLNVQQHRGTHYIPGVITGFSSYTIRVKYLDFICGGGSSELSRFRKLILFPFHAFW